MFNPGSDGGRRWTGLVATLLFGPFGYVIVIAVMIAGAWMGCS